MRYLLYGYYGYGNFGDDLLLQGVIEGVRCYDRDAKFWVHSLDPVKTYASDPMVQFVGLARLLRGVRTRPWRALTYLASFARWIGHSDILVIGGGTLFIDKGRVNTSLLLLLFAVWYARLLRRRVIVIGVAVDRLTNAISRWSTRHIFAAANFVAVREALSLPYVAHVPSTRVRLATDLVLGLELGSIPMVRARQRRVIGLCFIDYFRTVEPLAAAHQAYEEAILRFVERNHDRYDFTCIVFQRGIGQRDDWLVEPLHEHIPSAVIMHIDSLDAAHTMASAVDVIVTTRFHLGLLGLLWGIPVVVIDHELKMTSLAENFELPSITLGDFIAMPVIDIDALLSRWNSAETKACLDAERLRVPLNFSWLEDQTIQG